MRETVWGVKHWNGRAFEELNILADDPIAACHCAVDIWNKEHAEANAEEEAPNPEIAEPYSTNMTIHDIWSVGPAFREVHGISLRNYMKAPVQAAMSFDDPPVDPTCQCKTPAHAIGTITCQFCKLPIRKK